MLLAKLLRDCGTECTSVNDTLNPPFGLANSVCNNNNNNTKFILIRLNKYVLQALNKTERT